LKNALSISRYSIHKRGYEDKPHLKKRGRGEKDLLILGKFFSSEKGKKKAKECAEALFGNSAKAPVGREFGGRKRGKGD